MKSSERGKRNDWEEVYVQNVGGKKQLFETWNNQKDPRTMGHGREEIIGDILYFDSQKS